MWAKVFTGSGLAKLVLVLGALMANHEAAGFVLGPQPLALQSRHPASSACQPSLSARVSILSNPRAQVSRRVQGAQTLRMQSEKSPFQTVLVVVLGAAFVFGGLYPLINNGLILAKSDKASGSATGMRQKEIDERLETVPAFAVTDDKGTPFVAEYKGQNRGYFFLDPKDAELYEAKVKELQKDVPVKITPLTLDKAIKYLKSKKNTDPFEILPKEDQLSVAQGIKNPDTCDICFGAEGVKGKIPVFYVPGLGLEREGGVVVTPLFFDKTMAEDYYKRLNKGDPQVQSFDLSALVKKMRKGGSAAFRAVAFYPSKESVEYANRALAASTATGPDGSKTEIFPTKPAPP